MFDNVLFPTDGSLWAEAATDYVLDVAAAHDATLYALYVVEPRVPQASLREVVVAQLTEEGQAVVDDVAEAARDRGVDVETDVVLEHESVATTVVEYAQRRGVDLVVLPTHGRHGLPERVLGSVTERVVRTSDVPVLTVRVDVE
ncbi:universal stress protein [Haloplanus sp. GCM10025708]|uniref:universal stress protein n=1 Tax=Haloferacaceae TaxID=1644056 RepID=UPI0036183643